MISWDESLPLHLHIELSHYKGNLPILNLIEVLRNVVPHKHVIELHGFCAVSEKAYGACIYVRSCDTTGQISSMLLCCKSMVAPLKTLTKPRPEFWSDSTIVLTWIRTSSRQLKTFVGNRVSEIQNTTLADDWNHISTNENQADLLSRGALPRLLHNNLRWHGLSWIL
ncbi:hypothetical protein Trydic_g4883 [Trypoxylus dichotomus]